MRLTPIPAAAATALVVVACRSGVPAGPGADAGSTTENSAVTVPFTLDHNRMIVAVEFLRADGTVRAARAWVDTGTQALMLAEPLARELGVAPLGPPSGPALAAPSLQVSGFPLATRGIPTRVLPGPRVMPGVPAEANLPASALRGLHVVLDYPRRALTIARPGRLRPRGIAVPILVNPATGLAQLTAEIDGERVALALDNGSSSTWVSDDLTAAWATRHPAWPVATGAVGTANFFGFEFEPQGVLTRIPRLVIGGLVARDVAVLGLDRSLFEWYSKKTAAPVAGFIGANVLRGFRVELDLAGRISYWTAGPPPSADDLDTVGLTLRPEPDGGFLIVGVAARDGAPAVAGVQPGDRLLCVDAFEVTGATMGALDAALGGTPGTPHSLVVERDGARVMVPARVTRFP